MVGTKDTGILLNIIHHCIRIEESLDGVTKEEFDIDLAMQDIACFNILQIGELAKHLSPSFVNEYHGVPWQKIKGMRDIIVHGYGTIEMDRVWATATNDIKPLHDYCDLIINQNKNK